MEPYQNRSIVAVGAVHVDFHRRLKAFHKFEIATRVLLWGNHSFYLRQMFRAVENPARAIATASVQTSGMTSRAVHSSHNLIGPFVVTTAHRKDR
jgi:acyl-CoA thioesterase FadM